jgi:hypothetical protein
VRYGFGRVWEEEVYRTYLMIICCFMASSSIMAPLPPFMPVMAGMPPGKPAILRMCGGWVFSESGLSMLLSQGELSRD